MQKQFVTHQLRCFNPTEAARLAGYKLPNKAAHKLVNSPKVQRALAEKMAALEMPADEAIARLAAIAKGDMADFLEFQPGTNNTVALDLWQARSRGQLQLVKKYKEKESRHITEDGEFITTNREIELYDKQRALVDILKLHGRYRETVDHNHTIDFKELTDAELRAIAEG